MRLKVADVAKWIRMSETSHLWPGSKAYLGNFLNLNYEK